MNDGPDRPTEEERGDCWVVLAIGVGLVLLIVAITWLRPGRTPAPLVSPAVPAVAPVYPAPPEPSNPTPAEPPEEPPQLEPLPPVDEPPAVQPAVQPLVPCCGPVKR